MVQSNGFKAVFAATFLLWQVLACAADTKPSPPAAETAVSELMQKDLVGVPGKEALMLTVRYAPGGSSLPHRHDAQVFVYVLQGELTMQVEGSPPVTLRKGQTFYESPNDVHLVSANASRTAPAKILVFMVKIKGAPATRAATPRASTPNAAAP
ncbi:MAG TPA: cupin domain-containing protein [Steroidobacteraceae bacterium]